jgi:CBS domain-containing protein
MPEDFIGSVVVTRSSKIIGLFTERDLMMRVVGKRKDPEKVKIKDVMSESLITIGPWLLPHLMKEHRCRHLLVFAGDKFLGIVSLRDMVTLMLDEKEELIGHLEKYITSGNIANRGRKACRLICGIIRNHNAKGHIQPPGNVPLP